MRVFCGKILGTFLIAVACGSAHPAEAQTPLNGARVRVETAGQRTADQFDQLVQQRQWPRAAINFADAFESLETGLLPVELGGHLQPFEFRHWSATSHIMLKKFQQRSAEHPELLTAYRQLVDATACSSFRQSTEQRDVQQLARLADQFFFSSVGDEILNELAAAEFQAGRLASAQRRWAALDRRFLRFVTPQPVDSDGPSTGQMDRGQFLIYPDSELLLEQVAANLVTISIMLNPPSRSREDIAWFQTEYPSATGQIGGRQGSLVELLTEFADRQEAGHPASGQNTDAGSAAQQNRASTDALILDPSGEPVWKIKLASPDENNRGRTDSSINTSPTSLNIFPMIEQGRLVWQDGRRIRAIDLITGQPAFSAGPQIDNDPLRRGELWRSIDSPASDDASNGPCAITIDQGRALALVESRQVSATSNRSNAFARRSIIGIDLQVQGKLLPGFPLLPPGPDMSFDGTPLIKEDRLYVLARKYDSGNRNVDVFVLCYELIRNGSRGELFPAWSTRLCQSQLQRSDDANLAGEPADDPGGAASMVNVDDRIICNTNLGVIAALDAASGEIDWMTEYPRINWYSRDPDATQLPKARSPAPCLVWGDQIFVAPADTTLIFALDHHTGRPMWSQELPATNYLLGGEANDLIVSGDRLRWLDRRSGLIRCAFPENQVATPAVQSQFSFHGRGRPVVSGRFIYFPIRSRLFVLGVQPLPIGDTDRAARLAPRMAGTISLASRGLTGGHLFAYEGMMVLVQADQICAFTPTGHPLSANVNPDRPADDARKSR